MGIHTATTEQRPDIVLNITRESGEVVLTYLYDAKYRVINDRALDKDFEQQDADELLRELNLQYNKSRQQAITSELLDIVGGTVNN